jgi:hypothetical protein
MKKNMISAALAVLMVVFLLTAPATAAAANSGCEATLTHNGTVTEYETLKRAFANADNGDTITLEQNVTTDSYLHIEKDITFDLNHFSGNLDTLSMGVNDLTVENGGLPPPVRAKIPRHRVPRPALRRATKAMCCFGAFCLSSPPVSLQCLVFTSTAEEATKDN